MVKLFRNLPTRLLALSLLVAALCFGQQDWQTIDDLPGVDLASLPKVQRDAALKILRSESCTCGCTMKIAECRLKDPTCGFSRRLANFVATEASSGKKADVLLADLKKFAAQPPPVLEAPVPLSIDGAPMKGPANARVTIVEFSDFQCPFCAKAVAEVKLLLQKYPRDVRFVFKEFPLDTHSQAALAAEAALAAHAQGKFWPLHDVMYANYRSISRARILAWAKEIGLNMSRFQSDLDSHKYAKSALAERSAGEDAGVDATPTFFINGKKYNGVFDVATVAPLIAKELKP
jgi:protein-disulfide isomerase